MCQWRILVLIVWLCILTCKMFSSNIDCRRCVTLFPSRFKQSFAFPPFRLFRHSFQDNSNSVSFHSRLLVYKWSLVYPTLWGMILYWQMAWSIRLNEGMLILSDLQLPALPCQAPINAISLFQEYQLYYVHQIVRWSCGKVICHSQKYTGDQWVMQKEALWLYSSILYSPIEGYTLNSPNIINFWCRYDTVNVL